MSRSKTTYRTDINKIREIVLRMAEYDEDSSYWYTQAQKGGLTEEKKTEYNHLAEQCLSRWTIGQHVLSSLFGMSDKDIWRMMDEELARSKTQNRIQVTQ